MKSFRFINRPAAYAATALTTLLVMLTPALVPAFASAAQVSNRSIQLSSATAGATNVTYEVKFTVSSAGAAAFILDFCSDSPIPGQTCTAPTGFSASSAATSSSGYTITSAGTSTIKITKTLAGSATADVVITGITNPSSVTTSSTGFYARIMTYAASGDMSGYTATSPGSVVDSGGVAMAIVSDIGITAAVRESMVFCVAGLTITANCGDAASHPPTLVLGENVGGAKALDPTAVSTGDVFAQLSTNAVHGAVVNIKNGVTGCGGLKLIGGSNCIAAQNTDGGGSGTVTAGNALIGIKLLSSSTGIGGTATGTLQPVTGGKYSSTRYYMGYDSGNVTGVTSPYGDPLLDTNGAPVNNEQQDLTFGASAAITTPAGLYSANYSMIATGTF